VKRADLVELLSPEGLRLLDELPPYRTQGDVLRAVAALRKQGHPASLVATVLTQAKLRARAEPKFGAFASRMLFTDAGLEQATRLPVAALHAGRYRDAGLHSVADLGCGIGGDAMAMAAIDLEVTAVEADDVTAVLASYNLAPFPNTRAVHGRAEDQELSGFDGVFLDPARRTAGHTDTRRLSDPDAYSPALDFAFGLGERMPAGVKLGPGLDRDLIPDDAEAQWVSVAGHVVELGVWFGALARDGIRRSALVIGAQGTAELHAAADSTDAETAPLGRYLYEPDGAVIRARLIGDLARGIGVGMLSDGIAYLTGDESVDTPFASRFRVRETLPFHERELKAALRERGIGTLEIKKRGVDVDPAALRSRLGLKGNESATLVLTRVAGKHVAILADRD
jgi:SAM-dependent methyltransferases related to tRNA (uracil-5-)-methyltransferase